MWDQRYGEDGFAYGTEPNDFLKEQFARLNLPSGAECLMLADGQGRNGVWVAQQGCKVTSVDMSSLGLDKAHALATTREVSIDTLVADLADYNLGEAKWDFIVGIFCHMPPPVRTKVLSAIPAALKSGGYALFECYSPAQLERDTGGPKSIDMMYSSAIFDETLGSLETVENEEIERDVVEGKYHTGRAAVVQYIGRKK